MAQGQLKTKSCGSCDYSSRNPKATTSDTKAIKVKVTFEEALKLKAAIDECVLRLNRQNRATKAGKSKALELVVYLDKTRLQVVEGKL